VNAGRIDDIAIVGAGITGLSIAWRLAGRRAGRVVLYDGSGIGAGATGIQPGGFRQQWSTPQACAMARESFLFYERIEELLEPAVPVSADRCGYVFVAEDEDELEALRRNVAVQQQAGVPSQLLTAEQAGELVPGLSAHLLVGASYCADDGYFGRPQSVVAAFWESARGLGVELVNENVRGLAADGDGWRLELSDGSVARAGRVVLAAGADCTELLAPLGATLPIETEARHLFYSDPIRERLLEPLVVFGRRHFAAKQLADGSVLASDLSATGDATQGQEAWHRHVRRTITEMLPILEYVSFPVMVTGRYDVTPDAQPVLGELDGLPGLWIAAGMNGRGFMMAPAISRFIAESLSGEPAGEVMAPLTPSRFAAGRLIRESQVV
jgi:sarcosine oxidase subunit beta